jgi:hypothetical protein
MSDSGADAEKLAALIDGRLDERERSQLLAQLALSDEDLEILAEAAAVTREMEEEEDRDAGTLPLMGVTLPRSAAPEPLSPPPEVTPLRPRASHRTRWGRLLPLAAVLAGIALAPVLWKLTHTGGDDATAPAALLASARGLPPGWAGTPWEATRSGSAVATPRGRAVRVGARLVDLRLASEDPAASAIAADVVDLVRDRPGADAVERAFAPLSVPGADAADRGRALSQGSRLAASLAGREDAATGAWIEALRIAADRHDEGFVRSRALRGRLDALAADGTLPNAAAEPLRRARAAAGGDSAQVDWVALHSAATDLLGALAR